MSKWWGKNDQKGENAQQEPCYVLIVSSNLPQNSYDEALIPNVIVFGGGAFGR